MRAEVRRGHDRRHDQDDEDEDDVLGAPTAARQACGRHGDGPARGDQVLVPPAGKHEEEHVVNRQQEGQGQTVQDEVARLAHLHQEGGARRQDHEREHAARQQVQAQVQPAQAPGDGEELHRVLADLQTSGSVTRLQEAEELPPVHDGRQLDPHGHAPEEEDEAEEEQEGRLRDTPGAAELRGLGVADQQVRPVALDALCSTQRRLLRQSVAPRGARDERGASLVNEFRASLLGRLDVVGALGPRQDLRKFEAGTNAAVPAIPEVVDDGMP
mmetsp:Transcript_102744/g.273247  ORF Transcript_102744/g.273247 Transcript_102744/m.273247 type:complete len:271 (-) Transcript_102744:985-1797(-)